MDLVLMILMPVSVAAATSYALARRESVQEAGRAGAGGAPPRAAGFGRGGVPLPVERRVAEDASLELFVVQPADVPMWYRGLRLAGLAAVMIVAAAVLAFGLYQLGRLGGTALHHFVLEQ